LLQSQTEKISRCASLVDIFDVHCLYRYIDPRIQYSGNFIYFWDSFYYLWFSFLVNLDPKIQKVFFSVYSLQEVENLFIFSQRNQWTVGRSNTFISGRVLLFPNWI